MSWRKLLGHDLYCGLLRWRYLLVPALFLLPCLTLLQIAGHTREYEEALFSTAWADYLLFAFQGKEFIVRIDPTSPILLPITWLAAMVGCLLMNLDYFLSDLTKEGMQVILRSGSRRGWYLSKCLWNLAACGLYCLLAFLTTLVFSLVTGGSASLASTPELSYDILNSGEQGWISLAPWQTAVAGMLLPYLTLAALSMLQMTLCLFYKPILSFIVSAGILVVSVYVRSPLVLGNGAMSIRSAFVNPEGVSPAAAALAAIAVLLVSAALGTAQFQRTDILGLEE